MNLSFNGFYFAKNDSDKDVGLGATKKINDEAALIEIAKNTYDNILRIIE